MENLLVYSPFVVLVLYLLAFLLLVSIVFFTMLNRERIVKRLLVAFVPTGVLLLISVVVYAFIRQ